MKKPFLLSLVIFLFSAPLFSQQDFLFRGLPWGATPEQIKEKEGQPDDYNGGDGQYLLWYKYKNKDVAGYKAWLEYFMDKDSPYGMVMASYMIDINKTYLMLQEPDPTNFVNCYVDLQGKLISVYGNPKSRKNLNRIESGISVLAAQQYRNGLPNATVWETGITRIYLALRYESKTSGYSVEIEYITKPYWDMVEPAILGTPSKSTDGL